MRVASIELDLEGNIARLTYACDCSYDNECGHLDPCASHAEDHHSLEGGPRTRRSAQSFS